MNNLEINILVLKALSPKNPKTTASITAYLREISGPRSFSESEVFDCLVKAESVGWVRRVQTKEFDEDRPVSTVSWILVKSNTETLEASIKEVQQTNRRYIDEAMIVVSQPIFLSVKGVHFKNLGMPIMNVRKAMEKIVTDAKYELRIACPYYDELFIDVLSGQAHNVSKLKFVAVLAEAMDPILVKACNLFKNAKIKTLYKSASSAQSKLKIQGVHAKLMIADRSEVLIGSFNFRFSHIYYNVDLGLLARGRIAEDFVQIYDRVWGFKA